LLATTVAPNQRLSTDADPCLDYVWPIPTIGDPLLRIYELSGRHYVEIQKIWLEQLGLGLPLWRETFEDRRDTWLRWGDRTGAPLLTGDEQTEQKYPHAEQEPPHANR
jgi:hypothetical protein